MIQGPVLAPWPFRVLGCNAFRKEKGLKYAFDLLLVLIFSGGGCVRGWCQVAFGNLYQKDLSCFEHERVKDSSNKKVCVRMV